MVWGGRMGKSLVGGFCGVNGCPPNLLPGQDKTKANQSKNFSKMEKIQKTYQNKKFWKMEKNQKFAE